MLELKGLKKLFTGITVLNGVDISIKQGTKIGLSGGNGTGKSTLLNIATGFLTPEEGAIILNGGLPFSIVLIWTGEVCVLNNVFLSLSR